MINLLLLLGAVTLSPTDLVEAANGNKNKHVPHDTIYGIAIGPTGPGGSEEIVAATNDSSRVLRSYDQGLTWQAIYGGGLEGVKAEEVIYYGGGSVPRYLIGTRDGVWSYNPATGLVKELNDGLPSNDRWIVSMAASHQGDAPPLIVTFKGRVYLWEESTGVWQGVLDNGNGDFVAASTIVSYSDSSAPDGPLKAMAVGIEGRVYTSIDMGATWTLHPQFTQTASASTDYRVASIVLADDFATSGIMLVGTHALRPNDPKLDRGQLWRSSDYGANFTKIGDTPSGLTVMAAPPPGPTGTRHFFIAGNMYPQYAGYYGTGILRSDDGGLTWDDFGNEQDFTLEDGAGKGVTEPLEQKIHQDLVFAQDYATTGTLYYGRGEGLFKSRDNGDKWVQMRIRPTRELRDMAAAYNVNGNLVGIGASYGTGIVFTNAVTGSTDIQDRNCPTIYNKTIAVSPNFHRDGTVVLGGESNLSMWYDPKVAPANPFGVDGYYLPPIASTMTGLRVNGYPRVVLFSPNYDGTGATGDMTIFWNQWELPPHRSEDGGVTAEPLDKLAGGGTVPTMEYMAVAPTYDPSSPATKNDVYGASVNRLYRLNNDTWTLIHDFGNKVLGLAVDPTFSRPGNPRLFVALNKAPKVVEFIDDPSGVIVNPFGQDLVGTRIQEIQVPNDFGTRPVVYVGTWGEGILKYNFAAPVPAWKEVGQPGTFPQWWVASFSLSPDFGNDKTILVGTQYGQVVGQDDPNAAWQAYTTKYTNDNREVGFTTFSPNRPNNFKPDRAKEWRTVAMTGPSGQALDPLDKNAEVSLYDGDYMETYGWARQIELKTVSGLGTGTVTITVSDYYTSAFLTSTTVDLATVSTANKSYDLLLDIGTLQAVQVRLDVSLDSGELFLFDGMSFIE